MDHQDETPPEAGPIADIGRKASLFSRQFLVTLIATVSTALGVVVALAWNEALQLLFQSWLTSKVSHVIALFIYAIAITAVAVVVTISMGKLAARLDAEPIRFTIPEKEK